MASEESMEKQVNDELRLLYTSCVSEIANFKQQQWQVTNYGLLLFAAMASIPKAVERMTQLEFFLLHVAAFFVLSAGWYVLGLFSASIQVRRGRLTEIRTKHFTSKFKDAWRYGRSEVEVPDYQRKRPTCCGSFVRYSSLGLVQCTGYFPTTPVPSNASIKRTWLGKPPPLM